MTFAEFMRIALYHPWGAYYTSEERVGEAGDYYTSPVTHPVFGLLLAVQLQHMWRLLGAPKRFHVVELGSGSGMLARSITEHASRLDETFASRLLYVALDRRRASAREKAGGVLYTKVTTDQVPLSGIVGCILSNELLDSFPVHRFQIDSNVPKEIFVTLNTDGNFTEILDSPTSPEIESRLKAFKPALPDGYRGEVNLEIAPWIKELSGVMDAGFVLTIDYGYMREELYSPDRKFGTFDTYYRHTRGSSPFQRIGRQDMTAHVDFTALIEAGKDCGVNNVSYQSQAQFLNGIGLKRMLENLSSSGLPLVTSRANSQAMLELVKPDGLGGFKVLIQEKDTGINDPSHLRPPSEDTEKLDTPLLDADFMPSPLTSYPQHSWESDSLWPFGNDEPAQPE